MNARAIAREAKLLLIGIPVFLWTALPVYHMVLFAISPRGEATTGRLWPKSPTLDNFSTVFHQKHFYLDHFWEQLGNSVLIAVAVGAITWLTDRNQRRCPSGKPSSSAFWRKAPGVLLVRLAISATGVLARECCLSSWTCCFVHARRFRRPAAFFAARLLFFAMRRPSCEEGYVSRKIVIANGIGQLFVCSPNHTFTAN